MTAVFCQLEKTSLLPETSLTSACLVTTQYRHRRSPTGAAVGSSTRLAGVPQLGELFQRHPLCVQVGVGESKLPGCRAFRDAGRSHSYLLLAHQSEYPR